MNAAYLPPVARPPHDPFRYRLDSRAGWRGETHPALTQQAGPATGDGRLGLLALPESGPLLNDPSGSFGGLTWPDHVAQLPGGDPVLLDRARGRLRRFDPCACRFQDWPCFRRDPEDSGQPGNATESGRPTGMDCRYPEHTDVIGAHPPWHLDSGIPCQSDGAFQKRVTTRQLLHAGGLAAGCGRLYLCDTGHGRVLVLNPASGAVQAVWTSPPLPSLVSWQPADVAVTPGAEVVVSDPANGGVHVLSAHGRHRRFLGHLGAVGSLAVDCLGRLYARLEGESRVRVLDPTSGRVLETPVRPEEVAGRFPPLPVRVLAGGALDLSGFGLCAADPPPVFDAAGEPTAADSPVPAYPKEGVWTSQALDSEIARCPWHGVVLTGTLPPGTRATVYSFTAESEEPAELLALRSPEEWRPAGTWRSPEAAGALAGQCDFLLRSPPGRYLWLKLRLQGDGAATPRIDALEIEFPRISLRRYLPAVFGAEPVSADFTDRWLALFDRGFRDIESVIDRQARLFDPLACPAGPPPRRDFLTWLAGWVGVALERNWPEARRRAYLKAAPRLFPWRGTVEGLRNSLYLFLALDRYAGFEPKRADCVPCAAPKTAGWRPPRLLLEHFHLRRWMLLGHGKLSDNARLWGERIVNRSRLGGPGEFRVPDAPSGAQLGATQLKQSQDPCRDPFHVHAHKLSVFVPAACVRDPSLARALRRLVELERPAQVEARVIPVEPRFRIGVQAMLGLDAVIGWRGLPVRLDEGTLGRGTVLGGAVDPRPRFRVGAARIGERTILP